MLQEEELQLIKLKEKHKNAISNFGISFYFMLLKISITVITVVFLFVLYFRKRNKAEKTLKDTKELFYNVLDHTGAVISIKDLAGRYILVNQTYEDLIQTPKEKVKGKTVYDFFEKEIADAIRDTDLDVIKRQKQLKIHELVPKKGELRHFESLKFPLFDANQIPYALCCISTDETEKIQAELQHHEQMNKILDLFNNAPCGYQSTNQDGIITEMNDTLLKWLGYTRGEVIGKMPVRSLISKESLDAYAYYFPRFRTGELTSVYDLEVTYLRKNGSHLRVIANSMAHLDEDGKFLYSRTSIFDISFRSQVEELMAQN
jgi:PAS domain S-box-containing protein